jgi:signal transduction histidine kinase
MLVIKIAIIVSIILQIVAAILAISLTKVARYNISWIILTIAFLFMAARRVIEFFPYIYKDISEQVALINSWMGILISVMLVVALSFIRKLFNVIRKAEAKNEIIEKRILSAIINTEEAEKQRFAKDLHDGLGPLLSNIKMSVSALENMNSREEMEDILVNMRSVSQEAISSIKIVSNNLSPHILENFGLMKALNVFKQSIEASSSLKIEINSNFNQQRFQYNTEITLYRIITELINNTVKHAKASVVKIQIQTNTDQLLIYYSDNGVGTTLPSDPKKVQGQGLSNMLSRIKTLHGNIHFQTKPGKGFIARIVCPIQA